MAIVTRKMHKSDIRACVKIARANHSEVYEIGADLVAMFQPRRWIAPDYYVIETYDLTGTEKPQVIGFCGFAPSPMGDHVFEIFWMNIRTDFQGKGYGTKLLKFILAEIEKCNPDPKMILLLCETFQAQGFYEKHGFEIACVHNGICLMSLNVKK